MEQKQHENEEYARKKAELEKENEELKARLQELQLKTEEHKALVETLEITQLERKHEKLKGLIETFERIVTGKLEWKDYGKPTLLVLGESNSNKVHLLNRDRTRWSTLSLNLSKSNGCGGAVLDGEIYIFSGWYLERKTYKLNREMKWIQLADMKEARRAITNNSVVFDGCIWVFGGWNGTDTFLNCVEKYIPEENKWVRMPSMKESRHYAAAAACQGKLFVSGGMWQYLFCLRSMECFDPASQKWTMFLDLPHPTCGHVLISDGIFLTVLGGTEKQANAVWKINPNEENATWKELPQMRESRYTFTANLLGNNIFAIGGWKKSEKVEFFNGDTWEDGPELPESTCMMCSLVIPAYLAAALSSQSAINLFLDV